MQQMMAYANANTTRNPPAVHNPPSRISTFQPLEASNQVGTQDVAEGWGVGMECLPL
jgi:hypothetical protein